MPLKFNLTGSAWPFWIPVDCMRTCIHLHTPGLSSQLPFASIVSLPLSCPVSRTRLFPCVSPVYIKGLFPLCWQQEYSTILINWLFPLRLLLFYPPLTAQLSLCFPLSPSSLFSEYFPCVHNQDIPPWFALCHVSRLFPFLFATGIFLWASAVPPTKLFPLCFPLYFSFLYYGSILLFPLLFTTVVLSGFPFLYYRIIPSVFPLSLLLKYSPSVSASLLLEYSPCVSTSFRFFTTGIFPLCFHCLYYLTTPLVVPCTSWLLSLSFPIYIRPDNSSSVFSSLFCVSPSL